MSSTLLEVSSNDGCEARTAVEANIALAQAFSPGTWTHFALSWDGSTLRAYHNAQEVGSVPFS